MTTSLLSGRWRAVAAVLATVTLLAAAACKPIDPNEPSAPVWAVDVDAFRFREVASRVGDKMQVTLGDIAVYATACGDTAFEYLGERDGYGHTACVRRPSPSHWQIVNFEEDYPELRLRELTATAHVAIVAEYGTQEVKTLLSRNVGPLTIGEPLMLEPVSHLFDPSVRPANNDGNTKSPYRIYAKVSDCQLSNGAACGNNSNRYFFDPPKGIGTSEQGLGAAGAGLTIPDRAGGLTKLKLGSGQEGGRATQPNQDRPVGGVPVRRIVQGLFQAGDGLGRVYFWGAELAEPQSPQNVDRSGEAMVKDAFRLGVTAGAPLAPRSEMRQYDARPLGGQVWCQTFEHTLLAQTSYACGWVDQATVGTISIGHHAIKDLRLTEAKAAALLVRMRGDIETNR